MKKKEPTISRGLRLPTRLWKRISKEAKKKDKNTSKAVRRIIEDYFNK